MCIGKVEPVLMIQLACFYGLSFTLFSLIFDLVDFIFLVWWAWGCDDDQYYFDVTN